MKMPEHITYLQEIISMISEEHYKKMVEEVEDYAIFLLDTNGIIRNWNKGAERIKGYSSDEIIGRHFEIFYTKRDRQKGIPGKLLNEAIKNGRTTTEGWRVRKDGATFWAGIVITSLYNDENKLIGFTKITRDLTEQKEAKIQLSKYTSQLKQKNEALRRSEERYQMMVEEVEDYAIFMLDLDGTIKSWNRGAQYIKGYSRDEIIGEHFSIFYTAEDRANQIPEKNLEDAATEGKTMTEGWRVRKDGSTFWASIVITALYDDAGWVIGFTKITKDLTDQRLIKDARQLALKYKDLEELVPVISHELQEYISLISAFAGILENDYKDKFGVKAEIYLHYITDSCTRTSDLVKTLLDYLLIGRKKRPGSVHFYNALLFVNNNSLIRRKRRLERIDCNSLVGEVIKDLNASIRKTRAKISLGYLPFLNANSVEMKLLFKVLIGNAITFRKKGFPPEIFIMAHNIKEGWEFTVSDNGIGMKREFGKKIFDISRRMNSGSGFEGIGIGLPLCKKIVDLYDGSIWVESIPGFGSTFHFTIPQGT